MFAEMSVAGSQTGRPSQPINALEARRAPKTALWEVPFPSRQHHPISFLLSLRKAGGRKEGRKEGRKGGREEGRDGGMERTEKPFPRPRS